MSESTSISAVATRESKICCSLSKCIDGKIIQDLAKNIPLTIFPKEIAKGKIFIVQKKDLPILEDLMEKIGINIFYRESDLSEINSPTEK